MKNYFSTKYCFLFLILYYSAPCIPQKLSINETVEYINNSLGFCIPNNVEFLSEKQDVGYFFRTINSDLLSQKSISFSISNEGLFDFVKGDVFDTIRLRVHYSDITMSDNSNCCLEFKCLNNIQTQARSLPCIQLVGKKSNFIGGSIFKESSSDWATGFKITYYDKYLCEKLLNAFKYLLSAIIESGKHERKDADPFAPENYVPQSLSIFGSQKTSRINLEDNLGVYKIWVKISGINKQFILDSGASDVSISKELEQEFISEGILTKKNYIAPALYKLADGTIIRCRRFVFPEITVGGFTLKNVVASVGVSEAPLLLGKSFLDGFKRWSIDNSTKELILEK